MRLLRGDRDLVEESSAQGRRWCRLLLFSPHAALRTDGLRSHKSMHLNYRFRVHRLGTTVERRFQLRVGLEGDRDVEFLPVHRTAFAGQIPLEAAHAAEADVHLELSGLLEWLDRRGS